MLRLVGEVLENTNPADGKKKQIWWTRHLLFIECFDFWPSCEPAENCWERRGMCAGAAHHESKAKRGGQATVRYGVILACVPGAWHPKSWWHCPVPYQGTFQAPQVISECCSWSPHQLRAAGWPSVLTKPWRASCTHQWGFPPSQHPSGPGSSSEAFGFPVAHGGWQRLFLGM